MVDKPYHAPYHVEALTATDISPLPWRDFVARPWTIRGGGSTDDDDDDTMASAVRRSSSFPGPCQEGFARGEVVPCDPTNRTAHLPLSRQRGFTPVYELSPEGRPYDNLLDLRADKIANFVLHVPFLLLPTRSSRSSSSSSVVLVRYEDVLRDGAGPLVADVAARMQQNVSCVPPGPQPERLLRQRRPLEMDPEFRHWVARHVHTEMEELVGYDVGWVHEAKKRSIRAP